VLLTETFCLRISILKDQKEQQNQHLVKLHRIGDELREQAVDMGEKLVNTSEKHMELLKRWILHNLVTVACALCW